MINRVDVRQLEQKLINSNAQIKKNSSGVQNKNFGEILGSIKSQEEIKFSKHAQLRLNSRNIVLNEKDMAELKDAFYKAENKGIRDALILLDNQAFIANINNKTVITAVERENLEDNVFTNIDGAVII